MIIINQDKTSIINFDNVTRISLLIDDEEGFLIGADTNSAESSSWDLGRYNSKERVKEILQEIANKYTEYYHIKGGHSILNDGGYIQPNMFDFPKVYEMPIE